MANIKKERLEKFIREEISRLLSQEVTRSSVKKATITDVRIAADFSNATVYIDVLDRVIVKRVASDLNSMAGYFKTMLAKTLSTWKVPNIHFVPDETIDRAERIESIIREIEKEK